MAAIKKETRWSKELGDLDTRRNVFFTQGAFKRTKIIHLQKCVYKSVVTRPIKASEPQRRSARRKKKNTGILCVGVNSTCGALEARCWNAVSHETEGDTEGPG